MWFSEYKIFLDKQPKNITNLFPENKPKVTFLNPYSISFLKENIELYSNFDFICSDGILPVLLIRLFGKEKMNRYSFDYSSLANIVLKENLKYFFVGSTPDTIKRFVDIVTKENNNLIISGYNDGYFLDKSNVIDKIIELSPDVVVIGMGTPRQDFFADDLAKAGFSGAIYTCGGFFHQVANSSANEYYPKVLDKLNLRFLWRMYKEPYTIKRYFFYYPIFVVKFILFLVLNRITN